MAEIQVGAYFSMGNLVTRSAEALETSGEVRLTGINFSAGKVIDVAELLKHKVKGIHQINLLESFEGKTRLTVILSLKKLTGVQGYYSAPIPADQVVETSFEELKTKPPRKTPEEGEGTRGGNKRGGRGNRRGARGRGRTERGGKRGRGQTAKKPAEPKKKAAPKKPAAEKKPSKFTQMQKLMEEEKRQDNEVFMTNADIASQQEQVLALAKSGKNVTLKAIGNNMYKAVTIAEAIRTDQKLNVFSKISSRTHEGTSFSVYEAVLTKSKNKPDKTYF